jgi:4-aminobutyrate aminotransferase
MASKFPELKTELPGPKAKKVIERDERFISKSYTRSYPMVAEKGEGAVVEDIDGNRFLDFTAGIAVCATGHAHPEVLAAIKKQAESLIHMSGTDFYYAAQVDMAEKMSEIAPMSGEKKSFFGNSGAEAVEAAMKLARYYTKRPVYIGFYGAFHGRTYGAVSLTCSKSVQRKHFSPLLPSVVHTPYAYCYRCPFGQKVESCDLECVKFLEDFILEKKVPPEDVAAIFVEPIQGEGGYVVPPDKFIKRLHQIARKYGIMFVSDEVQAGMGRTGKMFAIEHFGVEPDMISVAKGIASGMPLGIMVSRSEIMDAWVPGSHASTFGGNPVSCAAAMATIKLVKEKYMANAAKVGGFILDELNKMKANHRLMGDVRGKGLMIAIEFVKDKETKEKAVDERNKIVDKAFKKGLLLLGCGANGIRFSPPLVIDKEQAERALSIFEESLTEVEKG